MIGDNFFRSSPANERDIARFMRRTGQVECLYNHGLVASSAFAVPLDLPCKCCGAAV